MAKRVLLQINNLLSPPLIDKIHDVLGVADFKDGKATAGVAARQVKNNEELEPTPEQQQLINRILMSSFGSSQQFYNGALPVKMADFIIARYRPGMDYGYHIDEAVMGASGPKFRTDLSVTAFLVEPEHYEGGELVISTAFGEQRIKLAAGDAIIYPSTSLHRVSDVTSGERIVALTWVQSMVRDAAKRELLFDLVRSRDQLQAQDSGSELHQRIDKSYANLLRMWAEV